jgi:hypothetical protein
MVLQLMALPTATASAYLQPQRMVVSNTKGQNTVQA